MKRLLLTLLFFTSVILSNAQVLLSNNFDSYNGLPATIAPGWYYSFNDSNALNRSYYNTTGFCGVSCNTYKFAHDTVTVITPAFTNADSVQFYLKGNGQQHVENNFTVLESSDSSNWTVVADIDSIPPSATTYTFPLNSTSTHLMFVYHKDSLGYNVGLDDIFVFQGSLIGIDEAAKFGVSVYPNPTNGPVYIQVKSMTLKKVTITVTNILGKLVSDYSYTQLSGKTTLDLSSLDEGIYMIRIKADNTDMLQRVLIRK
jgi:hypothetical protein